MKNIHVIPTVKPSRLRINQKGKLILSTIAIGSKGENRHIYITSDEEIKERDYFIAYSVTSDKKPFIMCASEYKERKKNKGKIILTTDQNLIKDGVQAIDDEFLEWFVKNPSYEYVLITNDFEQVNQDNPVLKGSTSLILKYKITMLEERTKIIDEDFSGGLEMGQIISKEETQSYICPKTNGICDDEMCDSASNCNIDNPLLTDSKEISFEEISNKFHQIAKDYKVEFNDDETKISKTYSDNQDRIPKQ